jgi:hypothetical protein
MPIGFMRSKMILTKDIIEKMMQEILKVALKPFFFFFLVKVKLLFLMEVNPRKYFIPFEIKFQI